MIKRLVTNAKKLAKKIRPTPKRRNRVSILVHIRGEDAQVMLLSPAFFMQSMREKDQCFFYERVESTRRRLEKALFAKMETVCFVYFGKYDLKASATYTSLFAMVLYVEAFAEVPRSLIPYLQNVDKLPPVPRAHRSLAQTIAAEVKEHHTLLQ